MAWWSWLGAIVACYWGSRATWRATAGLSGWPRLLAAHAICFAVLFVAIGLIDSYFSSFAVGEASVVVLPQLFWLLFDAVQGKLARR